MNYDEIFFDSLSLHDKVSKNDKRKAIAGELFSVITDAYGRPVIKKIADNIVVAGGAIHAAEKITNGNPTWRPSTLNSIYHVAETAEASASPKNAKVCLVGIGNGGSGLSWGSVVARTEKAREIPSMIPLRVGPTLDGTVDADKYFFKTDVGDGAYRWYLKELPTPTIRTRWKDSGSSSIDGTEVLSDIHESSRTEGLQTYAEYAINFNVLDGREYYEAIDDMENAFYNTMGLFTGEKVEISPGVYEYVNVRLYSYMNFNLKDITNPTTASYLYRTATMV